MKLNLHINLFLKTASHAFLKHAVISGCLGRLIPRLVLLLVGSSVPLQAFAAFPSWSASPGSTPINTPTVYRLDGLPPAPPAIVGGPYVMWTRPVYRQKNIFSNVDDGAYGPWKEIGRTKFVNDTYVSATVTWDSSVQYYQIQVTFGTDPINSSIIRWQGYVNGYLQTLDKLNVTLTSTKTFQQQPEINSASATAWYNSGLYPGQYLAKVKSSQSGGGPLVWQLYQGTYKGASVASTPGATIDSVTGEVKVSTAGTGGTRYVYFYVYQAANAQCNASPPSDVFKLTVQDALPQAPVVITSDSTTSQGSGYIAKANGGSGTGAFVWSLGAQSTPAGAKIGGAAFGSSSSSGALTTTGAGSVVLNVYRAGDNFYLPSAVTTMTLTVTSPVAAITKSVGEAVTISSAVKGDGSNVTFTVINAEGASPGIALSGGSAASIGESSTSVNAILKPGKEYSITVTGTKCTDYWLNFTPPAGFILLVDGKATNSLHKADTTGVAFNFSHSVQLRPEASYDGVPFGFFSGVRVDKAISWEIGLGNLRNGRSAGRVIFRENTLSADPVNRAKLYYAPPANVSEIDVKFDGTGDVLRQIKLPQGFLDLVDDANGGYWLKFYARSSSIVSSGVAPVALYNVPSDLVPWKTIRVELTGEGQLKFTEKEVESAPPL